jgi:hypothetical protein
MSHSKAASTPEWTRLCVEPPEGRFDVTALKMGKELTSFKGQDPKQIAVYVFPATRTQDFIAGGPPPPLVLPVACHMLLRQRVTWCGVEFAWRVQKRT